MFAMPDLMAVGVGALGGVATPVILGKVFARDPAKVPTWLKGNTGLLVQAAFGVVLGGLIGKFGSRKVGTSFALGASMIPVAQLLAKQGFLAPPVFGESDVSAFDLMGGDYATTMGEVEADEDVLELSGVGADDEAEDLLEMGF